MYSVLKGNRKFDIRLDLGSTCLFPILIVLIKQMDRKRAVFVKAWMPANSVITELQSR